jgi:molybdate transport system substrate-binding protein
LDPPAVRKMIPSLVSLLIAVTAVPCAAFAGSITVFAAASLSTALTEVATLWKQDTGHDVRLVLAGSSVLARQIEQGAPADVFISANTAWMAYLQDAGLIAPNTQFDVATNALVLIGAGTETLPVALVPGTALATRLGANHLALALVDAVPAGIYAKQALQYLGAWDAVASNVVQADNVRAALALVALGEVPFGVVYATDALAEPRVNVLAEFPSESHDAIHYPAAVVADSDNPLTSEFLTFLHTAPAQAVFLTQGFALPNVR